MDTTLELNCYFITYIWMIFVQGMSIKIVMHNNLKVGLFRVILFILSTLLILVLFIMYYNIKGIFPVITVICIGLLLGFITIPMIKEFSNKGYTGIFYFIWPIYFLSLYGKLRPYITF